MVKNLPANAEDVALMPKSEKSAEEGNGNPVQYSCLGNPMDRGTQWATVQEITKSHTRLGFSPWSCKRVRHDSGTKQLA